MARSKKVGVELEVYGDGDVFLSLRGVSREQHQAQIRLSRPEARKLAIRLLKIADKAEQEEALIQAANPTRQKKQR